MLEDGGMLVSPSKDGRRPGYRSQKAQERRTGGAQRTGKRASSPSQRPGASDSRSDEVTVTKKQRDQAKANRAAAVQRLNTFQRPAKKLTSFPIDEGPDFGFTTPITKQRTFKNLLELDKKDPTKFMFDDETDDDTLTEELKQKLKADRGLLSLNKLQKMGLPEVDSPSALANTILNATLPFRNYTLDKNIDYFKGVKKRAKNPGQAFYDLSEEGYSNYMKDRLAGKIDAAGNLKAGFMRDASGNIMSTGNDGRDDSVIIPTTTTPVDVGETASEEDPFGIPYRFFADGGMPKDAPVGGIMDIESGRQMYFLGKLVKKATRAVKKIVKSPIGKAALLGGALYFGGAGKGLGSFFGKGSFNPLRTISTVTGLKGPRERAGLSGLGKLLSKFGLADFKGGLTGKGMLALGGLGLTALPFLTGQEEEEDQMILDRGPGLNMRQIREDAILNPGAVYANAFRLYGNSGGRAAFDQGGEAGGVISEKEMKKLAKSPLYKGFKKMYKIDPSMAKENPAYDEKFSAFEKLFKKGFQKGGDVEPVAKETMPLLKMGGKEMDLRDDGGFVPIGRMERADDVPARLSKNEFVFTADAVRNAGGGDIDKGAEVMYNTMKNLEAGGEVSEETQGLDGARNMFQTAKRLEEVL